MWNALFGSNSAQTNQPVKKEEFAFLVDGTLRVPLSFPTEHGKNVIALRQWVFDSIAKLPKETVEQYTFKVLPDGFVYWFSTSNDHYGLLLKFDYDQGRFTGVTDQSVPLPQLPLPPTPQLPQHTVSSSNNHNNHTLNEQQEEEEEVIPIRISKRSAAKRTRK